MQLMIDTVTDDLPTIRRTATLLQDIADQREESDTALADLVKGTLPNVPAGTTVLSPIVLEPEAPPVVDTAAIFAKPAPAGLDGHGEAPKPPVLTLVPDIIPLVPPPPPVSGATAPATSSVTHASTATAPVLALTVERDSSGLPWDARIHQESRKQNKDHTWQNRRGLDKNTLAAVTAELRFNATQQQQHPAPPARPLPPIAPAGVGSHVPLSSQAAPPPPPVTVPPPPPGAPGLPLAPGGIVGFRELMQKITANTNSGKLTNEQVDAALHSVGLPPRQLIGLVSAPELIPNVTSYIDACLAAA